MPKNSKKKSGAIVWAIDPVETKISHRAPLAKAIKVLSRDLSQKIMPFSVVSPGGLSWQMPVSFPLGRNLQTFGERSVRQDLKRLHMRNIQSPTIEVQDNSSRSELVTDVLRFAKEKNAGYIAVNTRRLLSPFPFKVGGFAEALIGKSNLPVLAVNPKAKVSDRIKRILFPTDFTHQSHRAFQKTVDMASRLGAQVILLNVELPLQAPFSYPETAFGLHKPSTTDADKTRRKRNQKRAEHWCEEAEANGVKCSFQAVQGFGSPSWAILKAAKRTKADLISLAGYRNPKTPAIMGGTVRDILSSAKTPVMEFHA